jgi:isopenicillin N synthase-like dioxygenase
MSTSSGSAVGDNAGIAPVVDLKPAGEPAGDQAVADRIAAACERSGFFLLANHGVDEDLIAQLFEAARGFFALPAEQQRQVAAVPDDPLRHGLSAAGRTGRSQGLETPPDLCLMFRADRHGELSGARYPNRWPTAPPGFREATLAYFAAMTDLRTRLFGLFALALGEPGWFHGRIENHNSMLAINYYPPFPAVEGQFRKGEHRDYGMTTFLVRDAQPYGLQVQERDGSWVDVPVVPGTLCVNIGDLLSELTSRRRRPWVSSVHRVPAPPRRASDTDRSSIAFFAEVNPAMRVVPIGAEEVGDEPTAGEFIARRVAAAVA